MPVSTRRTASGTAQATIGFRVKKKKQDAPHKLTTVRKAVAIVKEDAKTKTSSSPATMCPSPERKRTSEAKVDSGSCSPTKMRRPCRRGDGCATVSTAAARIPCSPLKQSDVAARSSMSLPGNVPRYRGNDENDPGVQRSPRKYPASLACHQASPARLVDDPTTSLKPLRLFGDKENKATSMWLARPDVGAYRSTKEALSVSQPARILCREREMDAVRSFLRGRLIEGAAGSMYVSGAPGTGKTACLAAVMSELGRDAAAALPASYRSVVVNCMSVKTPQAIFNAILAGVTGGGAPTQHATGAAVKRLQQRLTSGGGGAMVLLVLDEMDQLDSKDQFVLYTLFELTALPRSRLVMIGIANALDLTDRILPRLQARPNLKPRLLNFAPYTRQQIVEILQHRLAESKESVVETNAVQFCARKVAAVAGDMRKALDVCRRAVEIVESETRRQHLIGLASGAQRNTSPKKQQSAAAVKTVNLTHISSVMAEADSARLAGGRATTDKAGDGLPLQQKLLICTLLLTLKKGKAKEIPLGKLFETYAKVCRERQVTSIDQSELSSLCTLLESQGIVTVKKAKDVRMRKITLKMDEKDVEFALKDRLLMSSVLNMTL
ncbi:PREDICTED: cell division control protein 6 homolog isoform X2 [Priapulus caudatus]|nr:PREDICTED: cell division control protein 6 homolog isoform X2 [Priapulus caudatus]XP_014677678.1 PREDICTED: cell division control protein 6 homolog isoform X2 [Priapulus caudatus]